MDRALARLAWVAMLCLGEVGCGSSPRSRPSGLPASSELSQKIEQIARAALREQAIPGLSVVVMRGDDLVLARGFGHADLAARTPATAMTTELGPARTFYYQGEGELATTAPERFHPARVPAERVTFEWLELHSFGRRAPAGRELR